MSQVKSLITTQEKKGITNFLENCGIKPYWIPLIKTVPVDFDLNEILKFSPDFAIFPSKNAVKHFFSRVNPQIFKDLKIIAVGKATGKELEKLGFSPEVPEKFSGDGVVSLLRKKSPEGKRFLIVRPEKSTETVSNYLKKEGFEVKEVVVYKTVFNEENRRKLNEVLDLGIKFFCFTSPSNFKAFLEFAENCEKILKNGVIIPIGETTAKFIESLNFKVFEVPEEYSLEGIAKLLCRISRKEVDK